MTKHYSKRELQALLRQGEPPARGRSHNEGKPASEAMPGWPKVKPCPGCSEPRLSRGPGDRMCGPCKAKAERIHDGPV